MKFLISVLVATAALMIAKFNQPISQFLIRWHRWHPLEGGFEIEGIPVIPYRNLASVSPFVARVESKRLDGITPSNITEDQIQLSTSATQKMWISVTLKKMDSSQVAIVWETLDTNALAFIDFLREGTTYQFPSILDQWR